MKLYDGGGSFVGDFIPEGEGDGLVGCLVGLVFVIAMTGIFGPSVLVYYLVKKATGGSEDSVSGAGVLAAVVVFPIWIAIALSLMGWQTPTSTSQSSVVAPTAASAPVASPTAQPMSATTDVNIRSGPGKSYGVIGGLHKGDQATPNGQQQNGWIGISVPMEGWVYGRYLK